MLWWGNDRGTSILEGGLWIALVVLGLTGAGVSMAETLQNKFSQVDTKLKGITIRPLGIP